MAQQTLALHHSPVFHTHFKECLTGQLDRFIEDVSRIYERHTLPLCAYEYPESFPGQCDGQPCSEKGTVHDLASDLPLCSKHFSEVNRG